jgi:hypothetical protein
MNTVGVIVFDASRQKLLNGDCLVTCNSMNLLDATVGFVLGRGVLVVGRVI